MRLALFASLVVVAGCAAEMVDSEAMDPSLVEPFAECTDSKCDSARPLPEEENRDRSLGEDWDTFMAASSLVQPGDIIMGSSQDGFGCWYLNNFQNSVLRPHFCHAAMVIEVREPPSLDDPYTIVTIEAFNEDAGIGVNRRFHRTFQRFFENQKFAVVRVVDDEGYDLPEEDIQAAIDLAVSWEDVHYRLPPFRQDGVVEETGTYCSHLPYRAYLDALGIDLDGGWTPLLIHPDDLYRSENVRVIAEPGWLDEP